jgi:hypothetical protein
MSVLKKLGKSGMFGLAGLAATNPDITNKIARKGGLGIMGMMLAKKKKKEAMMGDEPARGRGLMGGRQMAMDIARRAGVGPDTMPGRPMAEDIMVAEEVPAGAMMRKGGKVKKMAKGGSTASKRGDGCATKGKTKGRFV